MPFKDPLLGLSHRMEVDFNNTSLMKKTGKNRAAPAGRRKNHSAMAP